MKIFKTLILWTTFSLLTLSMGCQSVRKPSDLKPPHGYLPAQGSAFQQLGENFKARFAPDGKSFVFLSAKRPQHSHSQLYEYDLQSGQERRITFQSGEVSFPSYTPDGQRLLYSSSTDEIKEDPLFIQRAFVQHGLHTETEDDSHPEALRRGERPLEIYRSLRTGSRMERLTHSRKLDGEADMHPSGDTIIFTSFRSGRLQLYTMNARGQSLKRFSPPNVWEAEAHYSPDGQKLVWVRYLEDFKTTELWTSDISGQNRQKLLSLPGWHQHPRWSPDSQYVIFSSNFQTPDHFELYLIRPEDSCVKRLTYNTRSYLFPDLSLDQQKLLYTVEDQNAHKYLEAMDYRPPQTCLDLTTDIESTKAVTKEAFNFWPNTTGGLFAQLAFFSDRNVSLMWWLVF